MIYWYRLLSVPAGNEALYQGPQWPTLDPKARLQSRSVQPQGHLESETQLPEPPDAPHEWPPALLTSGTPVNLSSHNKQTITTPAL